MEGNSDFVWGMDDDAYPEPDALWNLMEVVSKYDVNTTVFWSNCFLHLSVYEKGKLEFVDGWMFVRVGLSRKMIEEIGYPRSDLFIFGDDNEYAQRIIDKGYKIVKVHDSIMIHEGSLYALKAKAYCH